VSTWPGQESRQIFVGNVSFDASEKELADALEDATIHVHRVRIVTHKDTGKSRGFAFIDIDHDDPKTIEEIIEIVNKGETFVRDRALRADHANQKPRKQKSREATKRSSGRGHSRSEMERQRNEFDTWD
jgi:RNA recognition motif-containing protein